MTMKRPIGFYEESFIHVYGRGNRKQSIFSDDRDYARFLMNILYFQYPLTINNAGKHVAHFIEHRMFDITIGEDKEDRLVELLLFCPYA